MEFVVQIFDLDAIRSRVFSKMTKRSYFDSDQVIV